ncbi:hypothetical protein [Solibacillus cecembensis]|uniref:hypothetical protein n=1 Tax=Solibacillus cecembensis TaxID=459347 RepID=UPI003D027A24
MKKTIITSLAILISIGGLTTVLASTKTGISQDELAHSKTVNPDISSSETETYQNELTYFKTINPNISRSQVESLMKLREQVDGISKQLERLELEYGILVDNTKDPNKEPKNPEELTVEQLNKLSQAYEKFWNGELEFLEASYKAGITNENDYKIDKESFEDARDNNYYKELLNK